MDGCDWCHEVLSERVKFLKCVCKSVSYCNQFCQKNHWNNGHRKTCAAMKLVTKRNKSDTFENQETSEGNGCGGLSTRGVDKSATSRIKGMQKTSLARRGLGSRPDGDAGTSRGGMAADPSGGAGTSRDGRMGAGPGTSRGDRMHAGPAGISRGGGLVAGPGTTKDLVEKTKGAAGIIVDRDSEDTSDGEEEMTNSSRKGKSAKVQPRSKTGQFATTEATSPNEEKRRMENSRCASNSRDFGLATKRLKSIIERNADAGINWAFAIECRKNQKFAKFSSHSWKSPNFEHMAESIDEEMLPKVVPTKRMCIHCKKSITGPSWGYLVCRGKGCKNLRTHFECVGFPDVTEELARKMRKEYECYHCHTERVSVERQEGDFEEDKQPKRSRKKLKGSRKNQEKLVKKRNKSPSFIDVDSNDEDSYQQVQVDQDSDVQVDQDSPLQVQVDQGSDRDSNGEEEEFPDHVGGEPNLSGTRSQAISQSRLQLKPSKGKRVKTSKPSFLDSLDFN
eukprot:GFUD01111444.1.p1 GENE.GFUD01111444.1~~GFUD01111444.1.p1  ORF type:complete len:519 (-),score=106.93 GFUD01111444.1:62-1579(-)